MGNPFSSILDVTKTYSLFETGRSIDFSYDDYTKDERKSERVRKEKRGYWGGHDLDEDC